MSRLSVRPARRTLSTWGRCWGPKNSTYIIRSLCAPAAQPIMYHVFVLLNDNEACENKCANTACKLHHTKGNRMICYSSWLKRVAPCMQIVKVMQIGNAVQPTCIMFLCCCMTMQHVKTNVQTMHVPDTRLSRSSIVCKRRVYVCCVFQRLTPDMQKTKTTWNIGPVPKIFQNVISSVALQ